MLLLVLLKAAASISCPPAPRDDGDTPLDWAKNKPKVAELLRKNGAKTGADLKAASK